MWDWQTKSVLAKGPARIAVIAAHPDDPDFACAGSCAVWAEMGHHVTYVIVTNGDKGSDDRELSQADLIALREKEQRDAARILGVADVVFLGRPDGMVVPDLELRRELVRVIRQLKPDVVLCESPDTYLYEHFYINHPDHRAVAKATLEAVFPASQNHRYFPELLAEGLEPHKVREVWIDSFGSGGDTIVDVTTTVEKKIGAIKAHKSQIEGDDVDEWVRKWLKENGERADPPVEFAESYRVMRLDEEPDESPPQSISSF